MSGACPELGFDVRVHLHDWVDGAAADALLREMLEGPVEELGLAAEARGGRAAGSVRLVTVRRDAGQATDADREAVARWAASRDEIERCAVGPLVDLSGTV